MADTALQRMIQLEAMDLDLDPALALSLAHQESGFNPRATSPTGVQGVFQVTQRTGREYGQDPQARTNPVESTEAGLRYFKDLLTRRQGDVRAALMDYNGGSDPDFDRNVLRHYAQYAGTDHPALATPRQAGRRQQPQVDRRAIEERIKALEAFEAQPSSQRVQPRLPGQPSPAPLDAPMQQVSPEEAASLAQRSQFTLDIAKPSVPREEVNRRIDEGIDRIAEEQRSASGIIPPIVGGVLGAVGGSLIGMPVTGGIVGGALGERASKWMGTSPPEEPIAETPVANLYPSDITGAMGALVPNVLGIGKAVARGAISLTRVGRALNKAEQATAEQAAEYLAQYQRTQAAAQTKAADQTVAQAEAWRTGEAKKAGEYVMQGQRAQQAQELRDQRAMARFTQQEGQKTKQWAERTSQAHDEAAVKTQQDYETWQVRQAQRTADHAQAVADAERQADEAWQAVQAATEAGNQAALHEAREKATLLQKQYRQSLESFKTQEAQHTAAAGRLQQLPQRYMPQLPGRTVADVRRDMALLDQGGREADSVLQRLGVADIGEASSKLATEGEALMSQGATGTRRAEEALPSPFQKPVLPGDTRQDLQQFLRQRTPGGKWGMKLEGEELHGELARYISKAGGGTSGQSLQNNRNGFTLQEMAERAAEEGFLTSPDKRELLEKLQESLVQGKPIYRAGDIPPAPALPGMQAAAAPTARKTARASDVLYQRLDDVAGGAPVDVALGRQVAESMREEVLSHMPSMQDTLFRRVVTELVDSEGDWSVAQVHKAMKDLGSYTRGNDPDRKYLAGQLSKGLQDALEQSAGKYPETTGKARDILLEANRTWRTEHGVDEIADALRVGGTIVKKDAQGQLVVNLKALQNLPDVLAKKKKSFLATGALDETTWQQFVDDMASFQGTPARPTQRPPLPGSVPARQAVPVRPTPKAVPELVYDEAPVPVPPRDIPPPRPGETPLPGTPRAVPLKTGTPQPQPVVPGQVPFEPPAPVEPTITAPSLGRTARLATGGVATGVLTGPTAGMVVGLGAVGLDWAEFVLSKALLTGPSRKYLLANIGPNGEIDPRVLGAIAGMLHIPGPEPTGER